MSMHSMVGQPDSTLGENSDVTLNVAVEREVCPNNLAPTTSTMGMGDALAVALINARDVKPNDFAIFHPGGSLGKKLLTQVRDAMQTNVPAVQPNTNLPSLAVILEEGKPKGIITDGDLRRAILKTTKYCKTPYPNMPI